MFELWLWFLYNSFKVCFMVMWPSPAITDPSEALVEVGFYVQNTLTKTDLTRMHAQQSKLRSNSCSASQILMFYCNRLHHLARVKHQCTGQLLAPVFPLICLFLTGWRGTYPVWSSEPASLLYCQKSKFWKSAVEIFPTSAATRSMGANVL